MFEYCIRMPELKNVLFLLDPKIASRAATTNKKTRNAARHRMLPPRAKYTRAATQAAKLGKVRYKSNKKSQNLNKIYNSLGYMGIANQANWYNNINNYIILYNQLRNASITQKEKDRLKRKMIKWKSILGKEIQKRIQQYRILNEIDTLNMNSPNYKQYRWS